MENCVALDLTHQPSTTSPSQQQGAVTTTTAEYAVLVQFKQMRSMISSFLGAQQDFNPNPHQPLCNYLYSEIEHLEEQDLTFRNETVKLHDGIQYKTE